MANKIGRARRGDAARRGRPAFPDAELLRAEVLRRADLRPNDICVDLGASAGLLTIPLAEQVRAVIAVDPGEDLAAELHRTNDNVRLKATGLTALALRDETVDLVVSGYALHRLYHADKRSIVARARRWLRPGGRIVIGDLMFGLSLKSGGKLLRYGLSFSSLSGRRPATPQFWIDALRDAGFTDVDHAAVSADTSVVWGEV